MSNINVMRKNLGPVTAYKYAVAKGFQGTEEEFAELMASYASIAEDVTAESRVAEGDALGKQNGVDVGDQSPYYHANAKYHAEQAAAKAQEAAESAAQAEGAIEVDDTLSVKGRAADAKVTGERIEVANEDIAELSRKIDYIADSVGLVYTPRIKLTDGKGIKYLDGVSQNSAIRSYSNFIAVEENDKIVITMLTFTAATNFGIAFYSSDATTGFIAGTREKYNAETAGYEEKTFTVPEGAKFFRTTWCASTDEKYDSFSCQVIKEGSFTHEVVQNEIANATNVITENVLDPTTITLDTFINKSGTIGTSSSYAVTDFIAVKEGDKVACTYGRGSTAITMRYATAYNASKRVQPTLSEENVLNIYTVPSGVSFIRISGNKDRLTDKFARISINGIKIPYQDYYGGNASGLAKSDHTNLELFRHYPLTALPEYFLNTLAYRPLGELSTGYICLVSDDGDAEVATYTIPMLISKGVPGTFAVMQSSGCWVDDTNKATVLDAVANHGCCLAQHGGTSWITYDELTLNNFFDKEQEYWDTLGVTVYGAVCPAHDINNRVRAIAGGRFGCLRTGYDDGKPRYANYTNGARSNLYGLTSQSSLDGTVATQSAVLDACMENHRLRIIHWHENEMDANAKARLEAIIDYAKQIGMTFVTMENIPWIV